MLVRLLLVACVLSLGLPCYGKAPFSERRPRVNRYIMLATLPARKTFKTCCWLGQKSHDTGFTAFLGLIAGCSGIAAPFMYVLGRK